MNRIPRLFLIVFSVLLATTNLHAHFPWLNMSSDGKAVYFFGEGLAEKNYKLPPTIGKAKVFLLDNNDKNVPVSMNNVSSDKFIGLVSEKNIPADSNLLSKVTYGLFGTSRLDYYTLYLGGQLPTDIKDSVLTKLKWDLQAGIIDTDSGIEVHVLWKGKPITGAEVHLYGADGEENGSAELDSRGVVKFSDKQVVAGVNGIMLGHRVANDSGVFEEKEYESTSHYMTMTFHDPEHQANPSGKNTSTLLKPLPTTLTSFGAATVGEYLYVFSGHQGTTHGFSIEGVSDHFRRIRFDDPTAEWEELTMHEGAQSTALVSDGKYLYRVGGLTFENTSEEDTQFKSTTHFARYDIEANRWSDLAPLPAARSSLDAAVLGRSVFVAGGWNLKGESSGNAEWHDDILRFDLDNPENGWQSLKGPGYITRAASVAAHKNRLYLFGGIQTDNITRKVSIFDPDANKWQDGPELTADSSVAGFATSSFSTGGQLYVTGDSGFVYRLNEEDNDWDNVGRLMYPRMFLRLIPADTQRLLAIGGTSMRGGRMASIESFSVNNKNNTPSAIQWSNQIDGHVSGKQTVLLSGSRLYAFGGRLSNSASKDRSPALTDEAYIFNLQRQTVESLPKLPVPTEEAAGVIHSQTSEHRQILLFGGNQRLKNKITPTDTVLAYDPDSKQWSTLETKSPHHHNNLHVITKQDALWFFGGHHSTKDASVLHWWGDETQIAAIPESAQPNPQKWFTGAVNDDAYYSVGGIDESKNTVTKVDVFDFNSRSWRTVAAPNSKRIASDIAVANDKLYLFGARSHDNPDKNTNCLLEVYDIATDQWTEFPHELPGVKSDMRMFSFNDRLLFYGIDQQQQGVVHFVLLDPEPLASPGTVAAMDFTSTSSTSNEVESNVKLLMRRDANRDGLLTKAELGSRLGSLINEGDNDGDGAISYAELTLVMQARLAPEEEEK
ncbi:MAG: hypothetical protein CMJ76_17445 [Planctomycetaceae bacterium]|nr:hypothetical protein [Planctomycetaceae bacterium]